MLRYAQHDVVLPSVVGPRPTNSPAPLLTFAALMKIGIFFGGTSREREISFAGGRTVFDNLDKTLFQPVPIFVDSLGQFILLDWQFIYKGTIRDFYPPVSSQPPSLHHLQVYIESLGELSRDEKFEAIAKVGRQVQEIGRAHV